jgi:hypothetical protein
MIHKHSKKQGCGSGSGLDPYSIGSVDLDSESESRRAKMTHKSRQKFVKVHVLKCWMASSITWDILYGGLALGIGKLQFLVIKALDPDRILIRIGLQPQTLDPDPEKMNTDPQLWQKVKKINFMFLNVGCSLLRSEGFPVAWTSFMEA